MTVLRLFGLWMAGGIGTITRYFIASHLQQFNLVLPLGTLGVNCLGCFLMGVVFQACLSTGFSNDWRLWLTVGFLGGFTTFSAFAMDTLILLRHQETTWAWLYILASVVGGLTLVWVGTALGRVLFPLGS